jgi:hypothetical protein
MIDKSTVKNIANEKTVKQYCSVCHKFPPANLMPKKDWPHAIEAMTKLANSRLGAGFLSKETSNSIAAYYSLNAPKQLPLLPYYNNTKSKLSFIASDISGKSTLPLIPNIHSVDLGLKSGSEFIISDAEQRKILLLDYTKGKWSETEIGDVSIPLHSEVFDFDNDGDKDIIIADLGNFLPSEKLVGKIIVFIQTSPGKFKRGVLYQGVGRITDVRIVDIDNDGDLDIAVAIFGGGKVGGLVWLENAGNGSYSPHEISKGSGALNVSPVDLNNDGKIDFITLIAQEHEMAIALINKGNGTFEYVKIAQAPHPMFGFTSIELVDLDNDNDVDVLLTNGDALDLQPDPKPYHGVQWLENKGNLQFTYHDIGRFYGAAKAVAGDLDNDGDIDVVASSWNNYWEDEQRQGLIWYENDGKQQFIRHNISRKPKQIVSLELEDVTGNGLLDIIGSTFRVDLFLKNMFANHNDKSEEDTIIEKEDLLNRVILFENKSIIKKQSNH